MATAQTAQLKMTLLQLRQRVAQRLGDYAPLTATSDGTTTTLIDALNVNSAAENKNGCFLYCTQAVNAANKGLTARVTTTTDGTSTLTFTPAYPQITKSGDAFDVFNLRGIGFSPAQYTNAINAAINDAWPLGKIELTTDIASFDVDPPGTIAVPNNMAYVYEVSYVDSNGFVHSTLPASRTNRYGWQADAVGGTINIAGFPGSQADTYTIRLFGMGRQDALTNDTDTCLLNADYLISRACYHLVMARIDADPKYGQMTSVFLNESTRLRTRVRTLDKPGAVLVRTI